jgi:hypothetical protein
VNSAALTRWVLKLAYNDARAQKRDESAYREFVPFIRGDAANSPRPLNLIIGVIRPYRMTADEQHETGHSEWTAIGVYRVGDLTDVGTGVALARFVAVGVIVAAVIAWEPGAAEAARHKSIREICRYTGWVELRISDSVRVTTIQPGSIDTRSWVLPATLFRKGMPVEA